MDRFKFTTIAHRNHSICNPIGSAALDACLERLELDPQDTVIDIGCGKGEALIRLSERHGTRGIGVDVNPEFLEHAQGVAAKRLPSGLVAFQLVEAKSFPARPASYSAAICLGATHAYGSFRQAIEALAVLIKPDGRILIAEGYWKQEPDPEYLHLLGAERDELRDHAGNIQAGVEAGLTPVMNRESSLAEWDAYEGLYARTMQHYLDDNPNDPDFGALWDRISTWREGYERWGRSTLGFGTYIFRNSSSAAP